MSHHRTKEILKELREDEVLLREVLHYLQALSNRILGGVMTQIGESMIAITPGSQPQFGVAPIPSGSVPVAGQPLSWTSSDPVNAPVTQNASDPTGLTATVNVSPSAPAGTPFTLTWDYTNPDGTQAVVTGTFTVAPPASPDITGGAMTQTV